jgi:hypothetical protein
MDRKVLVNEYIQEGRIIIEKLDKMKFPVSAALWFYFSDQDTWKLLIATEKLDRDGPIAAYKIMQEVLDDKNVKNLNLDNVSVIGPSDSPVSILKSAIKTSAKEISGIRFTANTINNVFIEDAFIYRLT